MSILGFILLGGLAGVLAGIVGIGGGVILIPALIMFFGFSQKIAQGTTMAALVPPVGLLAAWVYYKNGNVDLGAALGIALGFFVGGFFGATFAQGLNQVVLQRIFGAGLMVIAIKFLMAKN